MIYSCYPHHRRQHQRDPHPLLPRHSFGQIVRPAHCSPAQHPCLPLYRALHQTKPTFLGSPLGLVALHQYVVGGFWFPSHRGHIRCLCCCRRLGMRHAEAFPDVASPLRPLDLPGVLPFSSMDLASGDSWGSSGELSTFFGGDSIFFSGSFGLASAGDSLADLVGGLSFSFAAETGAGADSFAGGDSLFCSSVGFSLNLPILFPLFSISRCTRRSSYSLVLRVTCSRGIRLGLK